MTTQDKKRRLTAIMFADIVGYTAMMQHNEAEGLSSVHRFSEVIEEQTKVCNGEVIEFRGDGCLVVFDSAVQAMHAAKAIQEQLQQAPVVPLRIGIHIGDIVFTKGNIYGDGVNLASRVESMGVPGSILVTKRVIHDVKNHPEFEMVSLGEFHFKNVEKPMEVFALGNEGFVVPDPKTVVGKFQTPNTSTSSALATKLSSRHLYGGMILAVLACVYLFYWRGSANLPKEVLGKEKNLAVMAFENQTGDNDLAFLGSYLSEVISQGFMSLDSIKIVNPATVRQFIEFNEKQTGTLANIYDYTKADYVINGSYYPKGDSLEVKVYISEGKNGHSIFYFPPYIGSKSDYEGLAGFIQQKILGYWVNQEDLNKQKYKPLQYQAWLEYTKGIKYQNRDNVKAALHLNAALEMEPASFSAYSSLYWTYMHAPFNPDKADSLHLAMKKYVNEASMYEKDLWVLNELFRLQDWDAVEEKAYEIFLRDPQNPQDNYSGAWAAASVNKPQKAIDIFSQIDHKFFDYEKKESVASTGRLFMWAHALNCLGRYEETIDLIDTYYPQKTRDIYGLWMKIRAHARLDQPEEIEAYIDRFVTENARTNANIRGKLYYRACWEFYLIHNEAQVVVFGKKALAALEESQYTGNDLMFTNFLLGNYSKCKHSLERYLEDEPNNGFWLSSLAAVYTKLPGNGMAKAKEIYEIIEELEIQESLKLYDLAVINTHLGNKEEAVRQLKSTMGNIQTFLGIYRWDPFLRPLFDHQAFQNLVKPDMERHYHGN